MNRLACALYRAATHLLPADFRRRNTPDLERIYREALERAGRRGLLAWTGAAVRGLWDIIVQATRSRRASDRQSRRIASTSRPPRTSSMMESTLQDVRLAARSLRKSPGFALAGVLTIAIGVGANTALFSVVNAVLLRPPGQVAEPDRLVSIYTSDYSGPPYGASSLPDVEDFRAEVPALAAVAAFEPSPVSVPNAEGVSESVMAEFVSGDYLDVLGVSPVHGRGFSAEEGDPRSGAAVAIIGHGFWTRRFGADPGAVGSTLRVSGRTLTVVGVAPEGFRGMSPLATTSDLWLPMSSYALIEGLGSLEERGDRGWLAVGRLVEGAQIETAQEQLTALASRLREAHPDAWTDVNRETRRVTVLPDIGLHPQFRSVATGFAALLVSVFVVTLLIACANLANLTLARASRRSREVAMKIALGASRLRIARSLLAESALLAAAGGAAGVGLAWWLLGATLSLPPVLGLDLTLDLSLDGTVLLFSTLLTLLTVLAVGLLPALRASRSDPGQALTGDRARGAGRLRWWELRHLLVIGQVAASLVLLVGAGLMLESMRAAVRLDPGFDVEGVATLEMDLGPEEGAYDLYMQLVDELPARVARLPGVEAVSLTDAVPMTPSAGQRTRVSIAGYEPGAGEDMGFQFHAVGPGFMDALGIEMLRGRPITEADDAEAPGVLIVNESFAARFWPGEDPIGKAVRVGGRDAQVVGLMRDILHRNLEDVGRPAFFVPLAQRPSTRLTLVARTSPGSEAALLPLLRAEARSLSDDLSLVALQTMDQAISTVLLPRRVASWLLAVAGALGMLLAAAGLYAVMSFLVTQRTREIGLRIALGARAGDVVRRVVRRGVALSAVGVFIGLVLAAAVTRLLESLLFDVSPLDPVVFSTMALAAIAVAAAASWFPARRAASVDPMVALRHD